MIWSIKFPSKDNFQSLAQCQELCLGIFFYFFLFLKSRALSLYCLRVKSESGFVYKFEKAVVCAL